MKDQAFRGRRTFLQRLVLVLGGTLGASWGEAAQPAGRPGMLRLDLRRCRKSHHQPEAAANSSGRLLWRGELLDPANGSLAGDFYADCFRGESAFGIANLSTGSNLELHTLKLKEGTLFGIGAGPARNNPAESAILGGTGKFAGARGTYRISRKPGDSSERSEIVIQLLG